MKQIEYTLKHFLYNKDTDDQLELIELTPLSGESKGAVFFIHGHQMNYRMGGWESLRFSSSLLKAGYTVLLPSVYGFGQTVGERDYAGPTTISKLRDTFLSWQKDNLNIPVCAIGASRGGASAALLAVTYPDLFECYIPIAGIYDMKKHYNSLNDDSMVKHNIKKESGSTEKSFEQRSAIQQVEKVIKPVLIIHGEKDESIDVEQAISFGKALSDGGKDHEVVILEGVGHRALSQDVFNNHIIPFLEKNL